MEFVLKNLKSKISVTGIANVHFFEFSENFYTENDKHPFYELIFVSSGKLNINSDDYVGALKKNSLIIHKPNESHSLTCPEKTAPTVIIIGFTCEGGEFDRLSKSPVLLSDLEIKKLAEIVKEGRNVFAPPYDQPVFDMKKKKNPPFGAEQMLKILLEYFLIGLSRRFLDYVETAETEFSETLSVNEIIAYIDDNYKEKITIDELAFIFRTNRSSLCKLFKLNTGKTIIEYVNNKKLESAKRKILSTDKTLTEIAEELNFESIHYFTRFFKKMTGLSPKEYRKSALK